MAVTFFGLEVVQAGRGLFVRQTDIEALPFADFWKESSVGSTMLFDPKTKEGLVYLHDWERFSKLFIETGCHRFNLHQNHP